MKELGKKKIRQLAVIEINAEWDGLVHPSMIRNLIRGRVINAVNAGIPQPQDDGFRVEITDLDFFEG